MSLKLCFFIVSKNYFTEIDLLMAQLHLAIRSLIQKSDGIMHIFGELETF